MADITETLVNIFSYFSMKLTLKTLSKIATYNILNFLNYFSEKIHLTFHVNYQALFSLENNKKIITMTFAAVLDGVFPSFILPAPSSDPFNCAELSLPLRTGPILVS